MLIGNIDPLKLQFELINHLINKGVITDDEAKKILRSSLNPNLSEEEKDKLVDSLFIKNG
jgi:hypothetical protein